MIDTELSELGRRTSPPPIETVYQRGAQIRRRRRTTVRGGAVAVAALACLTAGVVVVADDEAPDAEAAAATGAPLTTSSEEDECSGFAEQRSPADVDELRLLPAWLPEGQEIEQAWARAELLDRETCPRVSTALTAVDTTTGLVTRSLRVDGPSPEPYDRYEGPLYEPIRVRGATADLVTFPTIPGMVRILWTEGTGRSWLVEGRGLSEDELRRVVEELELGPTVTAGWLPPDLHIVYQRDGAQPDLPAEQLWWHAAIDDGSSLSLEVTQNITGDGPLSRLAAGTTVVDVRGHQGIAHHNGCTTGDCATFLSWEEAPGIDVGLSGVTDLETLLRIAESLEPVAADDPRISSD